MGPTLGAERKAANPAGVGHWNDARVGKGRAQEEPERWKGARYCGWVGGQSWALVDAVRAGEFLCGEGRGLRQRNLSVEKGDKIKLMDQGRDMSGCTLFGSGSRSRLGRAIRDWSNPGGTRGPALGRVW